MFEVVNNPVLWGNDIPITFALGVINRIWFDTVKNDIEATNLSKKNSKR